MSEPTLDKEQQSTVEAKPAQASPLRNVLLMVSGFFFLALAAILLLFGDRLLARLQPTPEPISALEGIEPLEVAPSTTTLQPDFGQGAPQVGDRALAFMLEDLQGNQVRLADYAGQHVVLNFWATWCAPCVFEMPELQATYEQLQPEGVVVLGLNWDEEPDTVEAFLERELDVTITFPILFDEHAETAGRYGVYNLPTTYFVNPQGVITAIHRGPLTEAQIEDYLAEGDL
ncbi:MAG TPA: TlpA disulfide reductase family protein [Candidatus Sulfomarinibacteraceae bacterium]|nr:TlpA disulfide reductase family protein [Candidatus Sulfomarinibacteraceae bacterium]